MKPHHPCISLALMPSLISPAIWAQGNIAAPSTLASYSNSLGNDPALQQHFLVVAVDKS